MNDIETRLEKELEIIANVKKDVVKAIKDGIFHSGSTLDRYTELMGIYLEEPTKATKAVVNRLFKPLIRVEELYIKRLERQLEALEEE